MIVGDTRTWWRRPTILRARAKLDRVLKDVAVFHAEGKPPLDTAQLVKDLTEIKKIVDGVENRLLTLTSLSTRLNIELDAVAGADQDSPELQSTGRVRCWNEG